MLTFVNSKLPDDWQISDKQYHIFQKSKSSMKYQIQTYILVRTWNLLFSYFTGVSNQTMKSIKCKKKPILINVTSNLIKVTSSYNISSGIKMSTNKKTIYHSVPKTYDFFQNSSVPFHQVIFDHSISCVLLINNKI